MNRSSLHPMPGALVILLAIVACALPGQTMQPAPDTNSNAIETAVVGTAQAAAQQTEQTGPITATAIPVPTETHTPMPEISISGTTLTIREDQSAFFTDYKAGIQLVIPTGWMAMRIDEEEYLKAYDSDIVLQSPDIMDYLTIIRDHDPVYFRLAAIDIRPGHRPNEILSYMNVIFQPDDVRSLEKWEQAERDRYHPQTNFKFLSASYPQTTNGTRVLILEQSFSAAENAGTIYYRGVFFSLPSGTIVLDFYTDFDSKDTLLPDFDQVVNSLTLLNP